MTSSAFDYVQHETIIMKPEILKIKNESAQTCAMIWKVSGHCSKNRDQLEKKTFQVKQIIHIEQRLVLCQCPRWYDTQTIHRSTFFLWRTDQWTERDAPKSCFTQIKPSSDIYDPPKKSIRTDRNAIKTVHRKTRYVVDWVGIISTRSDECFV